MKTKQAIETHGHLLEHIAIERITVEFEKLLTGTYCVKGLKRISRDEAIFSFAIFTNVRRDC